MRIFLLLLWTGCAGNVISSAPSDTGSPLPSSPTGSTTITGGTVTAAGTPTTTVTVDTGLQTTSTGSTPTTGTPTGTLPTGAWNHTILVDGDPSDFTADETFPVNGGVVYTTWDTDALYLGITHPDVVSGGPLHWMLVYIGDGVSGTTLGVPMNTQEPALPLPMGQLLRVKADGSWNSLSTWTGTEWSDQPLWLGTASSSWAVDVTQSTAEFEIPFASLGLGDTVRLHVAWVYEGAAYETSYAPCPDSSFVSGSYDPDYGSVYEFDRVAPNAPVTYLPVP